MNLQEARQFVAHFVTGDHTPEENAAFLQWLNGATLEELNDIADEYESMHGDWDVEGVTPTADWKARLESRLDRSGVEEGVVIPMAGLARRIAGYKVWVAAASVAVVVGAGAIWYAQKSGSKYNRPELPVTAKTVVNPGGGVEKQLILADGSKVLLNVASTLKYPETFTGSERVVELSGEAYFEVVPNAAQPFRVLIRDAEVDVLGTNFNVRAYDNEPVSKTTLIEGKVDLVTRSWTRELKPGEQAVIGYASTGDNGIVSKVDVDEVMAWKNGYFRFRNEEFSVVARVLSRYYNVDIQCDQNAAVKKISGSVSRDKGLKENLSQFTVTGLKFDTSKKIVQVTL